MTTAPGDASETKRPRLDGFAPPAIRHHSALYSHFVASMKIVLPAVAVGLALLVTLWPRFQTQEARFAIPKVVVTSEDLENLRMERPRYVGIDDRNQPFSVTARLATQVSSAATRIGLEAPQGDITLAEGGWLALEARRGVYDRQAETLDLDGSVLLYHDRGYALRTEHAHVALRAGRVEGDRPVTGAGPEGELSGDGFRIEERGARIVLLGRSRIVFHAQPGSAP